MIKTNIDFSISGLKSLYQNKEITIAEVIEEVLARIDASDQPNVWISRLTRDQLMIYADRLRKIPDDTLPLYGIPFAIKDNIDLLELPTSCGCPAFSYQPQANSTVVQHLIDAGAIPIGKTNLDQFATGLVGVRSPYGACHSVFDERYISGGSSSGSAVAVASKLVSFSLGTDTAGSGRVPAAFNNIVGLKPSRGALSSRGLVPACRSLDCISIFAQSSEEAHLVSKACTVFDPLDPFSRAIPKIQNPVFPPEIRFGVPQKEQLEFFGDEEARRLYEIACQRLCDSGGVRVEIDFAPFREAAQLLYSGPWVAERLWAVGSFMKEHAMEMHPTVRSIIEQGAKYSAVDTFDAVYRLAELAAKSRFVWEEIDLMLLPTAGTIYTIEEVLANPIQLNTNLGYYTNFVNLLDLAAVAIPAGFREGNQLPFGVTLIGPAFTDELLMHWGDRLHLLNERS